MGGTAEQSRVKVSRIRILAVELIAERIAEVQPEELAQVMEGVNEIAG